MICNGLWEYRPDFSNDLWKKSAASIERVQAADGALAPLDGNGGSVVWVVRSPYVLVGGRLDIDGSGAKFSLSWDGKSWTQAGKNLDPLFPHDGPAHYEYRLRCELGAGAILKRLRIVNDVQMAPLALPGMSVGENQFVYTDQSSPGRKVRITHEWVERSSSRPPARRRRRCNLAMEARPTAPAWSFAGCRPGTPTAAGSPTTRLSFRIARTWGGLSRPTSTR